MTEQSLEQRVTEALKPLLEYADKQTNDLHGLDMQALIRELWAERQSRIAIVFDLRQAVDRLTIENYRLAKERDALQVEMHKPRWRLV